MSSLHLYEASLPAPVLVPVPEGVRIRWLCFSAKKKWKCKKRAARKMGKRKIYKKRRRERDKEKKSETAKEKKRERERE